MNDRLEPVREEKLHHLLQKHRGRLEASGVALLDDHSALVVFDNLHFVARIDVGKS